MKFTARASILEDLFSIVWYIDLIILELRNNNISTDDMHKNLEDLSNRMDNTAEKLYYYSENKCLDKG